MSIKKIATLALFALSGASFAQSLVTFENVSVGAGDLYTAYLSNDQWIDVDAGGPKPVDTVLGGLAWPGNVVVPQTGGYQLPASTPSASPWYVLVSVTNSSLPGDNFAWLAGTLKLNGSGWRLANGTESFSTGTAGWQVDYAGAPGIINGIYGLSNGTNLQGNSTIPAGAAAGPGAPSNAIWSFPNTNSYGLNAMAGQKTIFATMITPVPEPEAYALALLGLGVMGFVARRRK